MLKRKKEGDKGIKRRRGYIVPASFEEDARGIDFWIKMPYADAFIPVQITQRGVRLCRTHQHNIAHRLPQIISAAEERLGKKEKFLSGKRHCVFGGAGCQGAPYHTCIGEE